MSGTSMGGVEMVARTMSGCALGPTRISDVVTVTLSIWRMPHRPTPFHQSSRTLSSSSIFTPTTFPASSPIRPWSISQTPASDVAFRTSTLSGPRTTSACSMISSGRAVDARDRHVYAMTASKTKRSTQKDSENRKTESSLE